jgi:flagellar basal-body rod protein FlgB
LPDATISALHAALNGLSERQRVISDNIANLETPQFLAGRVEFEASLARALEDGADPLTTAQTTFSRSMDPTNPNGNNVALDGESLDGIDTNLRYQLTTTAINDKFRLLRTAIGG